MKNKVNQIGQIVLALLLVWGFNLAMFGPSFQVEATNGPDDCWDCTGGNCYLTFGDGNTGCAQFWTEGGWLCGTYGDPCWGS